ncbi:metalloendopeptidase, glycoprotease family [Denitrovibrio acetiphilus DSM 12809]|uniref:tRNA N6-adenosine threonylcarbamoyltransferase n=1 Tax=Denitrovibrio acetiphilus (strain DSM 12809 / NBRC 114555 / N2460) TaxID=522772 RepID=D4H0R4_DENA2|nr:tRNA (adenosine(37)-N6)-threonylcarbamoyltransferase complex transferase subunit TsaD [Denitrovibrio acetiphilus]ADD68577.1 metalloendopeptidase, glycoprotease family [Denitrovibrio acetiphilus DSM 12809]
MIILGIESSCDETSLAVYDSVNRSVKATFTSSQAELHSKFGGVVPEVASRNHILKIESLFEQCMTEAGITPQDIDAIGVTNAPGLIGALFVGVSFAKALGYALKIPVIPVNHLSAHILASELTNQELKAPYLALIISGGHTHIYDVDEAYNFELLARTIDDAAGESFDKVAKMLGLGYPGGPAIEKLAESGDENKVTLPIAIKKKPDFSFSGLKTAVLNKINDKSESDADIAASFQKTVAETLTLKTLRMAESLGRNKIVVAGGVACNGYIRRAFMEKQGYEVFFPSPRLCTDNGDMIAYAASKFFGQRKFASLDETAHDRMQQINK